MKRVAVYAGSFDPITSGHLDLVRRATGLFDEVVLAIGNNPAKRYLLSTETRLATLQACTADLENECEADTDGSVHAFWGVAPGGSGGGRDKTKPIMRWQTWSTYDQCCNWIDENSPDLFGGGLHPSTWGDSNGCAHQISDTERLYQPVVISHGTFRQ